MSYRPLWISLSVLLGAAGCHANDLGTNYGGEPPGSTQSSTQRQSAGKAHPAAGGGYDYEGDASDMAPAPMAESEAAPSADAASGAWRSDSRARREVRPQERPGLGTEYGEQHYSSVRNVGFSRRSSSPDHVFQVYYDNASGVRSAAQAIGWGSPQWSEASVYDSGLSVRVLDDRGRTLRGAKVGQKTYALGRVGERYTIGIYNDTGSRQEVVASVDGLDVISGDSAHFAKRGYVVEAYSSVQIDGWRTSESNVAAFRFSPIEHSYAGRTGRARNVGVIGVAFFAEAPRYTPPPPNPPAYDPWRDYADPFPGN